MNDAQRQQIRKLRGEGFGYTRISEVLGISRDTIKTFCRREGLGGATKPSDPAIGDGHFCQCCGVAVDQHSGRKLKKFCSNRCRNKWWNSHLDQVNRKAHYDFVCVFCKKPFMAYGNADRKYCSHACYVADRFGGGADE